MTSTMAQPATPQLFPDLWPSVSSNPHPHSQVGLKQAVDLLALRSSFSSPALLRAKDFLLPELVGGADNGDLSVAGTCIDGVQLKQVFELAEMQERRDFASLSNSEWHLEGRRYKDFLKRKAKKGLCCDELEIWLQGGAQAEENFHLWWERKEERRRTALLRKANRLANCRMTGRRLDCSDHPEEHRFFGKFNCGMRYCRHCGTAIFADLFGKYMGLWPVIERLLVRPGFRSRNIISTLDFTAVNLGRMPLPKDIREFNQDVRACVRRVMAKLGISSRQFLFLWCDEFGGWDPQQKKYNTNLHAHGVFVGPYLPYEVILETWIELRKRKDGARGVFIKRQKLDHPPRERHACEKARFARALGHALKYTGKHVTRADGERLAQLEAAFHGVRRIHTMGLAYHANLTCAGRCSICQRHCEKFCGHDGEHSCKLHRPGRGCPICEGPLIYPSDSGYASIVLLKREGRLDLDAARQQVGRDRIFAGPRGEPA